MRDPYTRTVDWRKLPHPLAVPKVRTDRDGADDAQKQQNAPATTGAVSKRMWGKVRGPTVAQTVAKCMAAAVERVHKESFGKGQTTSVSAHEILDVDDVREMRFS